ncbi:hypothetical protein E6W39_24160 [Kitasatospora acidiphila]|uniref:Uncharacterized protein n=1 Tax=Kitasatospora acidiphila TaxID=2567942 RepID=A0A540W6V5_9ACTN|nr:hypothetical protein [Kitasatospora acidiphila]TQF04751.1 hypothetical protein E6W39_24160 [Kitasatospora acidiphila]
MTTTSAFTQYAIQHTITETATDSQDSANINLVSPAWSDATVAAFVQALEALPIPTGCTSQVSVSKATQTTVIYATNATSNPVTFS